MFSWVNGQGRLFVATLVVATVCHASIARAGETLTESEAARIDAYPLSAYEEDFLSKFTEPTGTPAPVPENIDPQKIVPRDLLEKAYQYYTTNLSQITNKTYLAVINFKPRSDQKRFFIINMNTGVVEAFHVAHGAGSDRDKDGIATVFSNVVDSNQSSLGFYRTAETYNGAHGRSLRLDGLSDTNSNVRKRVIVVHGADYVYDRDVIQGLSWGCPAISMKSRDRVVSTLAGGAIIYAGLAP